MESSHSADFIAHEQKTLKVDGSTDFDYTIDIFVKNESQEKLNSLRKVLEDYK